MLTKKGVLTGLEKFKYPLSGEFAVTRRFIETLGFPVNYGIESGMLIEIWRKKALNKVTEADLQLYQHFPRNDNLVTDMATQIVRLFLHELRGLIKLDEKVVNEYLKEAYREIEQTQSLYEEVEVIISQDVRRTFYKDIEGDRRRVKKYAKVLRNALKSKGYMKEKIQKMPPWGKLVGTFKGKKFQNYLRRRAVNYTYHVLSDQRIVTYD